MIDQAIEEYQKKRIAKIESETKRFEELIPAWAHQHLRVELGGVGDWDENRVLVRIEYPNAERIYVEAYRPFWFPLVVLIRYAIGMQGRKYGDLREAIAVASIRNKPTYRIKVLGERVPPPPAPDVGQSTIKRGG